MSKIMLKKSLGIILLFSICLFLAVASSSHVYAEASRIVFVRFHIKQNLLSFVTSKVAVGTPSDRTRSGELRVLVYASDHKTVLEEYLIPDPRKRFGPENFGAQTSTGLTMADDIDFDIVFPFYPNLRYVDIRDVAGEFLVSADLSSDLAEYCLTQNYECVECEHLDLDHDTFPDIVEIKKGTDPLDSENYPPPEVFTAEGRIVLLRVQDIGMGYGPSTDRIDGEVIIVLDTHRGRAFGFKLRSDAHADAHRGMLNLLRYAFINDLKVRIEYLSVGLQNGEIIGLTVIP